VGEAVGLDAGGVRGPLLFVHHTQGPFEEFTMQVHQMSESEMSHLRRALIHYEDLLKRKRKSLEGVSPEAVEALSHDLSGLRGSKEQPGIMVRMECHLETEGEKKPKDPLQIDFTEDPDRRTHAFTKVSDTRELVARIGAEMPQAEAVVALHRLEAGERERPGGGRQNHIDAIQAAREALKKAVLDAAKAPAPVSLTLEK